ncbi:hypothetical protein [Bdellovibrio sp. HCB209]|uniref:hypothetical protein n=1 Tax=Bdellovibrio sp. HCB209 TaxID=3394354 RepID=UPI0039B3AB08
MKMFKSLTSAVCSASIAFTPMVGFAAGVDGGTSSISSTPAINSSANTNAKKNKQAEAFNYVASATEFAVAATNWPPCYEGSAGSCATAALFTIMAIKSMQQAKENGVKAGQSYNTANLTDAYGTGNYDSSTGGLSSDPEYVSASSVGSNYMKKAEAGLSELQAKGLVNSSATKVTTPDGKTYDVDSMNSTAAMASAGIPQGAIDAAMEASKKIEKKALEKVKIGAVTAVNGIDEGGGGMGGGSGRSPSADASYSGYPGYGAGGKSGSLLDKDPSRLAAGMSKNYNGEPIGVAADSIFLMMSRRYKVKESQDSFFGVSDVDLKK